MESETQKPDERIISLSTELARPDGDERRRTAERWKIALHRLCKLRATAGATSYELQWQHVMEHQRLVNDLDNSSKLIALTAIEVLGAQHDQKLLFYRAERLPHDKDAMAEMSELIAALRQCIADDCPGRDLR